MRISYDYSNTELEYSLPPEDRYKLALQEVSQGEEKSGKPKLTWTFRILDGLQKGKTFRVDYNCFNANPDTVRIAMESMGKVYMAIKGVKPGIHGFDAEEIISTPSNPQPFFANLVHREYNGSNYASIKNLSHPTQEAEKNAKKVSGGAVGSAPQPAAYQPTPAPAAVSPSTATGATSGAAWD
jgi:hypothetical protein